MAEAAAVELDLSGDMDPPPNAEKSSGYVKIASLVCVSIENKNL